MDKFLNYTSEPDRSPSLIRHHGPVRPLPDGEPMKELTARLKKLVTVATLAVMALSLTAAIECGGPSEPVPFVKEILGPSRIPQWTPDGSRIVVSYERVSTSLRLTVPG